jgi:uncharacterized protein YjbI with pentapeptide repeats
MTTKRQLIRKLLSPDNKIVLQAVEELRACGWLEDGTLEGLNLRHAHFQRADLYKANLSKVNLSMADLRWTDLSKADLQGAQLSNANLFRADLSKANLKDANLYKANLQGARNITDDQLSQAFRLREAIMPDGSRYDGRFNLPGDLETARAGHIDINDPDAMTEFYGVAAEKTSTELYSQKTGLASSSDGQLVRKLRSSQVAQVARAVEELRRRGRLSDGTLGWAHLRYVHFRGIDLSAANLQKTNMSMADLGDANLAYTRLDGAQMNGADLSGADLEKASLAETSLIRANLRGAQNLTDEQFSGISRLRGATMPDGQRYDGRYNLLGDLADAQVLHVDLQDPEAIANFFGISLQDYLAGQRWAREHQTNVWTWADEISQVDADSLLIRFADLEGK